MQTELISPRRLAWTLGAVCLVGLGLRVYGLDYGLPGIYNPDETPILNRALALAKGDPNPHNFLYPSLNFYALFAWEVLFFLVGRVAGLFHSLADFQQEYFRDPTRLFLAARAWTALCGTLTIVAVYRFGQQLFDRTTGLVAAAFLAVAPFAVRDAHYVKLDVPVTLLTVVAHVAIARLVTDVRAAASARRWLWTGVLAGLAVSTQYYVLFVVVAIAAAAVADIRRSGRWQRSAAMLIWAAAGSVLGFLLGTPFFIVEPHIAMRDIAGVREVDIDRALAAGGGAFTSLVPYLKMLATDAIGWPVFAAAIVGVVLALWSDWRRGILLVAFPCAYLTFIAHTVPQSRYLDALLPLVAVAAACAVTRLARAAGQRAPVFAATLTVLCALPGLILSVRSDVFFTQTDTRTLAREFIEREIPDGASLLIQPYSAPVRASREGLIEALRTNVGSETNATIKFQLQLSVSPYPSPAYRTIYLGDGGMDPDKLYVLPDAFRAGTGLEPLRRMGIGYVILKRGNTPNQELMPLETALEREAQKMASFSPYRAGLDPARQAAPPFLHNTSARIDPSLERPGPVVDVWRVR